MDSKQLRSVLVFNIILNFASVTAGLSYTSGDKQEIKDSPGPSFDKLRYKDVTTASNDEGAPGNCTLSVDKGSRYNFSEAVLKKKYNFVYLDLKFEDFSVKEDDSVIAYTTWIWTYKGENGGYQYLYLPQSFGYLSFGLLWAYTLMEPMTLTIQSSGTCNNLTSGNDADIKLGEALGSMTEQIAAVNDMYNSSYWCYTKRIKLHDALEHVCENAVCTVQTYQYSCCKFMIKYITKERYVECKHEHYYHPAVWWLLPVLFGNLLWAYFPLFLTLICCRIYKVSRQGEADNCNTEKEDVLGDFYKCEGNFLYLIKDKPPVTFLGTVGKPFLRYTARGRKFSRLLRITIILLPFTIMLVQLFLNYRYNYSQTKAAVDKGASLGFMSMIAGFEAASKYFLVIFGGPYIALTLFVVFALIFIEIPYDLETFLERGLINFCGLGTTALTLSLETKSRLAGLQYTDISGFRKIQLTFLSNLLLLLNVEFWKDTVRLFINRWKRIIYSSFTATQSPHIKIIACSILILPYIIFCILEIGFAFLFFAFPVVSCLFILIKAYVTFLSDMFRFQSKFIKTFSYVIFLFIVLALCFTWYIYCILLFQCTWFVVSLAMFTYSGVIAYPKISYGYLILTFMTMYYIVDIFNKFSKGYQDLLNISIKACRKLEDLGTERLKDIFCDKGISKHLWEVIIERHRPRRILVATTVLQLCIVISVLSISVELLDRFNKFQELSLITHVFTVLAVCALPQLVKSMYIDRVCSQRKRIFVSQLHQTILEYLDGAYMEKLPTYAMNYSKEYERIPL